MDSNPDFYKPLADKLEELINARRSNRISQIELFKELDQIQNKIINKHSEAEGLGFKFEYEFAMFGECQGSCRLNLKKNNVFWHPSYQPKSSLHFF